MVYPISSSFSVSDKGTYNPINVSSDHVNNTGKNFFGSCKKGLSTLGNYTIKIIKACINFVCYPFKKAYTYYKDNLSVSCQDLAKTLEVQPLKDETITNDESAKLTIAQSPELLKTFNKFVKRKVVSTEKSQSPSLMLSLGTKHADEYNESVRRLPAKSIPKIKQKLQEVTDESLQKIAEIRHNPQSILEKNSAFFKDEDTSYILLKAFELEKISREQFFTLMSLHNEMRTNTIIACLPLYNEESSGLVVNADTWMVVHDSLSSLESYNNLYIFEDTEEIKQNRCTNLDNTIKELQNKMQSLDLIDRVIFTFAKKDSPLPFLYTDCNGKTVDYDIDFYEVIRTQFKISLFYNKDFIQVPNFTLVNKVVETIFGEGATSANLVLGSSVPDDIRNGMKNNYRDIGVSFGEPKLPAIIHWGNANYSIDLTLHDIAHLFINLLTPPSAKTFLVQTATRIHNLANSNNEAIEEILKTIKHKEMDVDTADDRKKNAKELTGMYKLLSYLKRSRMDLNKHDFMVYDGNFATIDEKKSALRGVLASSISDMVKAFDDHDKDHTAGVITPFNMKQICKAVCLQLKEKFDYLIQDSQVEFSRIIYQATWDALKKLEELDVTQDYIYFQSDLNKYNFIASMQAYLLENHPKEKHTENTNTLTNNDITSSQKIQNSVNNQDNNGNTCLHNNIHSISVEDLQKQINLGAKLDIANNEGDTVLHLLTKIKDENSKAHYLEIVNLLIKNGINLNIQNAKGETALHCEIKSNGLSNLAEVLISSDINVTLIDDKEMTAMDHILHESIKTFFIREIIPVNFKQLWITQYTKWRIQKRHFFGIKLTQK